MRINGLELNLDYVEAIPVIRGEEEFIFQAAPVTDLSEFDKVYPEPNAPEKLFPGGRKEKNYEDPKYLEEMAKRDTARADWLVIKSLTPSNLEWDTVNVADATTFANWRKDLKKAGLTNIEIQRIQSGVFKAQGLNSEKIEKAKKDFLASRTRKDQSQ